jgi:hypothetical protein
MSVLPCGSCQPSAFSCQPSAFDFCLLHEQYFFRETIHFLTFGILEANREVGFSIITETIPPHLFVPFF